MYEQISWDFVRPSPPCLIEICRRFGWLHTDYFQKFQGKTKAVFYQIKRSLKFPAMTTVSYKMHERSSTELDFHKSAE